MYPFSYLPKISKNHTIEGITFLKGSDNTCYKRPKIYLGVETFSYMEIILKSAVEPIPAMIYVLQQHTAQRLQQIIFVLKRNLHT